MKRSGDRVGGPMGRGENVDMMWWAKMAWCVGWRDDRDGSLVLG